MHKFDYVWNFLSNFKNCETNLNPSDLTTVQQAWIFKQHLERQEFNDKLGSKVCIKLSWTPANAWYILNKKDYISRTIWEVIANITLGKLAMLYGLCFLVLIISFINLLVWIEILFLILSKLTSVHIDFSIIIPGVI